VFQNPTPGRPKTIYIILSHVYDDIATFSRVNAYSLLSSSCFACLFEYYDKTYRVRTAPLPFASNHLIWSRPWVVSNSTPFRPSVWYMLLRCNIWPFPFRERTYYTCLFARTILFTGCCWRFSPRPYCFDRVILYYNII